MQPKIFHTEIYRLQKLFSHFKWPDFGEFVTRMKILVSHLDFDGCTESSFEIVLRIFHENPLEGLLEQCCVESVTHEHVTSEK